MPITRIAVLASFGALFATAPTPAALSSHPAAHDAYDGNVNVPYELGAMIKSETTDVVSGRTVRCPWRKGCSEISSP